MLMPEKSKAPMNVSRKWLLLWTKDIHGINKQVIINTNLECSSVPIVQSSGRAQNAKVEDEPLLQKKTVDGFGFLFNKSISMMCRR
jgi:hypothetical protein